MILWALFLILFLIPLWGIFAYVSRYANQTHANPCIGQKSKPDVFYALHYFLISITNICFHYGILKKILFLWICLWAKVPHWTWSLTSLASWASPSDPSVSVSQNWDCNYVPLFQAFYLYAEDLNVGSHDSKWALYQLTQPSLQPHCLYFIAYGFLWFPHFKFTK